MQIILKSVQGNGDYDRLAQGVYENYLNIRISDGSMKSVSFFENNFFQLLVTRFQRNLFFVDIERIIVVLFHGQIENAYRENSNLYINELPSLCLRYVGFFIFELSKK